jgi:hypothetical protein
MPALLSWQRSSFCCYQTPTRKVVSRSAKRYAGRFTSLELVTVSLGGATNLPAQGPAECNPWSRRRIEQCIRPKTVGAIGS